MTDVNKINHGLLYVMGNPPSYRVTITNELTGEIVYSNASRAGVLCSVESYKELNIAEVEGNQQHLLWGHPRAIVHAHIQSEKKIRSVITENPEFRGMALGKMPL